MGGFLSMGGYGAYVWPAYGVAALVLGGLLLWSLRARGKVRRELEARGLGPPRARTVPDGREPGRNDAQAQTPVAAAGIAGRGWPWRRPGADRVRRQPRVLLFADRDRREAAPARQRLRIGGLVEQGSVVKDGDG